MAHPSPEFENPQIEVISESPRLEMLQARLRQAGMRPFRADMPIDTGRAAPLLLDMKTVPSGQDMAGFWQDWRRQGTTRLLIILGDMPQNIDDLQVIHLFDIDQITHLPARLAIHAREQARQRENRLREETARQLGRTISDTPMPKQRGRMLYLGEASSQFIAFRAALDTSGIDLVAALTRRTAIDHLTKQDFDGIILNPVRDDDETCLFLRDYDGAHRRAQTKLFLMEDPTRNLSIAAQDAAKASQFIPLACTPEQQARMITTVWLQMPTVKAHRSLASPHIDPETGFYRRTFLERHLAAQMDAADTYGERLTVLTLNVRSGAMRAVAATLQEHLRETDFAARLDARHICVTLPDTAYRGGVILGRRLETVCGDKLKWRAVERRQFHTVKTLLSAGLQPTLLHGLRRA